MKEQHYNDTASDYFILLVLGVITLPATYLFFKRRIVPPQDEAIRCHCKDCETKEKAVLSKTKTNGPSIATILKVIALIVLWILLILVAWNVATKKEVTPAGHFDPYAILGLEPGTSMDVIKKTYKKLSLIHHPDKADDPTDQEVQSKYINIVKAYETLTDDATRENWEKYGNPDGPQAMSVGIALPSWLVKKDNTFVVLGVYMALLVVGLPSVVGCWWRSWKKYDNASKVMNSTMGLYYHTLDGTSRLKSIVETVGASEEYMKIPLRQSDEKLEKVAKWIPDNHSVKKKPKFTAPYAVKSHLLLYAQICRRQSELKPSHQADLAFLLQKIRPLTGGVITICTARGFYVPILESMQFLQSLTQSCWKDDPLLQLPHFTEYMCSDAGSRKFNAPDVTSFSNLTEAKKTEFYNKENLTPVQIKDIEDVLAFMPTNVGFNYSYEVEGEDSNVIVPKAVVTFSFTVCRDKSKIKPKTDEEKEKEKNDNINKKKKKPLTDEEKPKRIVHAPNFPEKREECWWVVLGDPRGASSVGALAGIAKVGNIDDVTEGQIKFLAPATEGTHVWTGHLICDGYIGFDQRFEFRFKVNKDETAEKLRLEQLEKEKNKKLKLIKKDGEHQDDDESEDEDDYDDYSDDDDEEDKE